MCKKNLFWILALGFAWLGRDGAWAQQLQPVTSQQADCGKFVQPAITTAGTVNSQNIDNRSAACDGFVVSYSPQGFATVSVTLQSANVTSTGAAGSFGSFGGTVSAGYVNPAVSTSCTTATSCEIRATGYFPYVRVQITTTGTGYLVAEVHGFKTNPNSGSGASGCIGTSGTPCIVAGPNANGTPPTKAPVLVAGIDVGNTGFVTTLGLTGSGGISVVDVVTLPPDGRTANQSMMANINGTTDVPLAIAPWNFIGNNAMNKQFACTNQALFNLSGSGNTQIIAASGTTTIRICHLSFATTAAEDVKVTSGTGANCGTGTADVTGLYKSVQTAAFDFGPNSALLGVASGAICLNQSAVQATGGIVIFAQF